MSCTYMSAMIVLIANKLTTSEHSFSTQVEEDDLLIDEGLDFVDQIARTLDDERLGRLCTGCHELNARATNAVMSCRFGGTWKSKVNLRPWPSLEEIYNTTVKQATPQERKVGGDSSVHWPSQYARLDDLGLVELTRSTEECSIPRYLGLIP